MNPRYLLLLLVVCMLVGSVSAWGADMGGWDYRKSVTINNTGAELTDYQVMFNVNRSAGSDSGFTVYLDGKCESDYDDIRFTTGENTLCDYWIESSSSTVATIWVEVPTIAAGDTTLYLYYGNSGASAVSDGEATFPFFDDFPGSSIDTDKWNVTGTSPTVSGGIGSYSGGLSESYILGKTGFGTNYTVLFLAKSDKDEGVNIFGVRDPPATNVNLAFIDARFDVGQWRAQTKVTTYENTNIGDRDGSYKKLEIVRNGTTSVIFIVDGATVATHTSKVPTVTLYPWLYVNKGGDTAVYLYFDWFAVRKYTATEPTVSAWGSEEEQFPKYLTVDFSGVPTSGYVPLTVYFTDATVGYNVTLDTWSWSFGDTSPNSTQQDPAHTYTTSGLYNLILTVTNTSFSKTNTTQKTAYINVTVNPGAPVADFTVTETCGDVGDTFYFIDFSTGGGLYAWNWSFGDGSYSELRNPTHQYASNGTYDVNLSVWGAYGFDSLLRENLITIPCGAPTPTPTPTVTVTTTPLTPGTTTTVEGGRLTPLAFVVLVFMVCGLTVYTFADNQNRNYLYIATAAVAMIVSFLLGIFLQVGTVSVDFVNTLDEVTVNESVLSTYDVQRVAITDLGFGWFFIFWGVVMLIITILAVIELFREPQRRYEE